MLNKLHIYNSFKSFKFMVSYVKKIISTTNISYTYAIAVILC